MPCFKKHFFTLVLSPAGSLLRCLALRLPRSPVSSFLPSFLLPLQTPRPRARCGPRRSRSTPPSQTRTPRARSEWPCRRVMHAHASFFFPALRRCAACKPVFSRSQLLTQLSMGPSRVCMFSCMYVHACVMRCRWCGACMRERAQKAVADVNRFFGELIVAAETRRQQLVVRAVEVGALGPRGPTPRAGGRAQTGQEGRQAGRNEGRQDRQAAQAARTTAPISSSTSSH